MEDRVRRLEVGTTTLHGQVDNYSGLVPNLTRNLSHRIETIAQLQTETGELKQLFETKGRRMKLNKLLSRTSERRSRMRRRRVKLSKPKLRNSKQQSKLAPRWQKWNAVWNNSKQFFPGKVYLRSKTIMELAKAPYGCHFHCKSALASFKPSTILSVFSNS